MHKHFVDFKAAGIRMLFVPSQFIQFNVANIIVHGFRLFSAY